MEFETIIRVCQMLTSPAWDGDSRKRRFSYTAMVAFSQEGTWLPSCLDVEDLESLPLGMGCLSSQVVIFLEGKGGAPANVLTIPRPQADALVHRQDPKVPLLSSSGVWRMCDVIDTTGRGSWDA